MKKPISLSLFFPAHNEEKNIRASLERAKRVVESSPYISDYELIVVDDGSTDATRPIAEALASHDPHIRVVAHRRNKGYGEALKSGLESASKEYVFFTDADLQFDIQELNNLLIHVPAYSAVIGYRSPRMDSFMRLFNAWGWNRLNRLFFGLRVRDIDCAFKVFKRQLVQRLKLDSSGAMINAELLIKLFRRGTYVKQVPVTHLPRRYGVATGAKLSVIARAFKEMVLLYGGDLSLIQHKEAVKFMLVGVVNTVIDTFTYLYFTHLTFLLSTQPVAAKFFSFLAGTVSSFLLNRYWTFGIREPISAGEVARFYTTVSIALLINVTTMYLLVEVLKLNDLVSVAAATVMTFAFNFTLSKLWVFKKTPQPNLQGI